MMQIALPDLCAPATLIFDPEERLSDDEYFDFCMANPDLRIERTAEGEIVIVPPAGGESDNRNFDVIRQFGDWAWRYGRGKGFGSSVQFILPDGASLSPDMAWVSNERLALLPKEQRRRFLPVVPEFIVEVMSPSDRLRAAQRKMLQWMTNGVELGWLIDGDNRCVYVYRQGCEMRQVSNVASIEGEGPVAGFVLCLTDIWEGL
jgi:Uma2 family endonuclease